MDTSLAPRALELLRELEANNDREWYAAHRAEMKQTLLEPLAAILDAASKQLARGSVPLSGGAGTMFRMNRDTRFSANKLPYKINAGGVLTGSGGKKGTDGLAYLHCEPGASFVAAGFYMPETAWLLPVRQRMVDDAAGWRKVLRALDKRDLALSTEHRLSSMPRGFADARDHEHADSLKLKSLVVSRPLGDRDWTDGRVLERLVSTARDARPLLAFGRGAH